MTITNNQSVQKITMQFCWDNCSQSMLWKQRATLAKAGAAPTCCFPADAPLLRLSDSHPLAHPDSEKLSQSFPSLFHYFLTRNGNYSNPVAAVIASDKRSPTLGLTNTTTGGLKYCLLLIISKNFRFLCLDSTQITTCLIDLFGLPGFPQEILHVSVML